VLEHKSFIKPLKNSTLWKLERDIILIHSWNLNNLLPLDFSESYINFGVLFPGDSYEETTTKANIEIQNLKMNGIEKKTRNFGKLMKVLMRIQNLVFNFHH